MAKDQKYDFNALFATRPDGAHDIEIHNGSSVSLFGVTIQSSLVDDTPARIYMRPVNIKAEELLRIAENAADVFGERAKITLTM